MSAGASSILPGFIILAGSLELAGKSFVGGSVRLVYSFIYSLFLAFSIGAGADLFDLMDRSHRRYGGAPTYEVAGSLIANQAANSLYNGT